MTQAWPQQATILIADKDADFLAELSSFLESIGFGVVTAKDEKQAVKICSEKDLDGVIVAHDAPGLNGLELCRKISALPNGDDRALLVTIDEGNEDQVNAIYDAGAWDFITKPVNWDILGKRLRIYMNAARHRRSVLGSEQRLLRALEGANVGAWDWDLRSNDLHFSNRTEEILGMTAAAYLKDRQSESGNIHPDDVERIRLEMIRHLKGQIPEYNMEFRVRGTRGRWRWVHCRGRAVSHDTDGRVARIAGTFSDIDDAKAAAVELEAARQHFMEFVDKIQIVVVSLDAEGRVTYCNPHLLAVTGWDREYVIGADWFETFIIAEQRKELRGLVLPAISGKSEEMPPHFEAKIQCANGEHRLLSWDSVAVRGADGKVSGLMSLGLDITDQRAAEETIRQQANYDSLTGLPNRTLFHDRLSQALATAARSKTKVGVLHLDLDRFKWINDSLGHEHGDDLLKRISERLQAVITRKTDTVARLGGDEFSIILPGLKSSMGAGTVAARILDAVEGNYELAGTEVYNTASIGIAVFPEDGDNPQSLLKNADAAMYQSKAHGRNHYRFFTASMDEEARATRAINSRIRRAFENGEFQVYYQPIVSCKGEVLGAEALLRWFDPEDGFVSPARFIPVAEDTGMIVPIGNWIIDTVCCDLAKWTKDGIPDIRMSVNLSPRQLVADDLVDVIEQTVNRHNVSRENLLLEITETVMLQDPQQATKMLNRIRETGIAIGLDDFGTGYSSLSHLKKFPIDLIKIDRSFVFDMTTDKDDLAVVEAIIALGQSLGKDIVAEGVETVDHMNALCDLECHKLQGFLFSKAVPADELAPMITTGFKV